MSKNLYKLLSISIEDEKKDGECQIEGKLLFHQMQGTPLDLFSLSPAPRFAYVHDFCHIMVCQFHTAQPFQQLVEHAHSSTTCIKLNAVAAAERDPNGMCCPTKFAEALKDCFRQADKQLLHWLERKHHQC